MSLTVDNFKSVSFCPCSLHLSANTPSRIIEGGVVMSLNHIKMSPSVLGSNFFIFEILSLEGNPNKRYLI